MMKARAWSKTESHKISNISVQNSIPTGGSFAKFNLFLIHFLWTLLQRKIMDGRVRKRFYRGEKEGEEVIDEREFNELKL
jgi:hypothetical protein